MERNQTQMKRTKWRHSKTSLEFNEIMNAERCTSERGDEFTGCTPTKESSKGHPAYACCQHTEAKEMQQKQSECSTKFSSEEKNRKRQARDKERKTRGSNKSTKGTELTAEPLHNTWVPGRVTSKTDCFQALRLFNTGLDKQNNVLPRLYTKLTGISSKKTWEKIWATCCVEVEPKSSNQFIILVLSAACYNERIFCSSYLHWFWLLLLLLRFLGKL